MTFEEFSKKHNLTKQEQDQCFTYLIALRLHYEDIVTLNNLRIMLKSLFR